MQVLLHRPEILLSFEKSKKNTTNEIPIKGRGVARTY
jgi:hypothetical protein